MTLLLCIRTWSHIVSLYYDSTYSGPTYYGRCLLDDTPVLQPEDVECRGRVGVSVRVGVRVGVRIGVRARARVRVGVRARVRAWGCSRAK